MKIRTQYSMRRKIVMQHIEELHQTRGNILRYRQITVYTTDLLYIDLVRARDGLKSCLGVDEAPQDVGSAERCRVRRMLRGEVADFEVAQRGGVEVVFVDFVEVAGAVDQYVAL